MKLQKRPFHRSTTICSGITALARGRASSGTPRRGSSQSVPVFCFTWLVYAHCDLSINLVSRQKDDKEACPSGDYLIN